MSAARRARAVAAALWCLAACGRASAEADDAALQGVALRHLFFVRERAGRLAVWDDRREAGPVFEALGRAPGPPVDAAAVGRVVGAPVTLLGTGDLERLFRDHPDGWAAFYRAYPSAPGLVEVGPVEREAGKTFVVVGRACGEQCLNAWRVEVDGGRVVRAGVVRVPR